MQSLDIPQGPRNPNGYTSDEVLRALRGIDGTRRWDFRYELLNLNNEKIQDLDRHIEACTVSQNFLAKIKRTASFDIRSRGEINFLNDRIKPYARLYMPPTFVPGYTEPGEIDYFKNSFDGASGDDVTVDNSGNHGTELTYVSGGFTYDSAKSAFGPSSIRSIDTSGTFIDQLYFRTFTSTTEPLMFRGYFYLQENNEIYIRFLKRDDSGNPSLDTDDYQLELRYDAVVDDEVTIGIAGSSDSGPEEDITSDVGRNLLDQWWRLDVEFDPVAETATYKFFWSDITDRYPDFTHSRSALNYETPAGFLIEDNSAVSDLGDHPPLWMDNFSLTNYISHEGVYVTSEDDYVEWPLGVFLLASPTRESDADDVVTRSVEAYDAAKVFQDDKLENRYTIQEGDNYIEHIKTLLGDVPQVVEPDDTLAARTRDWPVGTEKEDLINDITQFINYESLTFDEDGRAVIRPYILPDERSPEYDYADDEVSIMHPEVSQELDIFDIANKWIVVVSNPDQEPIKAVLENNNPADPTSIPRRQRTIVDFREEQEATDRKSLMTKVRRYAWEANREFEAIEFTTALFPIHSFNDCYTINYGPLGIKNKYTEHKWEMKLEAGSDMSHRARRVFELDSDGRDSSFLEEDLTVTGTVEAGNIAAGSVAVPVMSETGVRGSFTITGLDLQGSGAVHAQATAYASRPDLAREVTVFDEGPTGMKVWARREDGGGNDVTVHWFMMRDP